MRFRASNKMLVGVTSSVSCGFFTGQLRYFRSNGWSISLAASPDVPGQVEASARAEGADPVLLPMRRDIDLKSDIRSLVAAIGVLRRVRPKVMNAGTPKAGLLLGLAGLATGVPYRVYTVHGLRYEGASGGSRLLLRGIERVTMACFHRIVCVSPSVADVVVREGLVARSKVVVLGRGSANGVDTSAVPTRDQPHIPTVGYVGRLARDKGVEELVSAFRGLQEQIPGVRLVMAGAVDETDPPRTETLREMQENESISCLGHVGDVSEVYANISLLCLPSHREGLPSVLLEAALCGRPVVASTATGSRDAFVDGVTGVGVAPGDVGGLTAAMRGLLQDPDQAARMGRAGQAWVGENFERTDVWRRWLDFYVSLPSVERPSDRIKRAADRVVAVTAAIALAPVAAMVWLAVRRDVGKPALFRQIRPGRFGEPFEMIKFRTMRDALGQDGQQLSDADRLTPFGAWLRRTSLDELPSLWNVLRGDLSIVGPRPLLTRYTEYFTERERLRLVVPPGLTGWAQLQGRNTVAWSDRLEHDAWYVENRSLRLDLRIIAETVLMVVRRRGVVPDARSVMLNLDEERSA